MSHKTIYGGTYTKPTYDNCDNCHKANVINGRGYICGRCCSEYCYDCVNGKLFFYAYNDTDGIYKCKLCTMKHKQMEISNDQILHYILLKYKIDRKDITNEAKEYYHNLKYTT